MPDSLRTDLNEFLFAPVADDENGMHLTMLSVLARSGVDPWAEAAELVALPREDAAQKLAVILAGVPNGPAPGDDTATLTAHLIAQLHSSPKPRLKPVPSPASVASGEQPPLLSFSTLPRRVRLTIYSLVALILMAIGYRALGDEPPVRGDFGQQQLQ